MASSIVGHDTNNGSWAGYGTLGWWFPGTAYKSLPAAVSAFAGTEAGKAFMADPDVRQMALPPTPGGSTKDTYGGSDTLEIWTITTTAPTLVSLRLIALASPRPATITITTTADVVLVGPYSLPDLALGVWCRLVIDGAVKLKVAGTYPRWQGALIDPDPTAARPGRLASVRPGAVGLIG